MKSIFVVPALAAACLAFASPSFAVPYMEAGDAGDLPATAQVVSGPANTPLTLLTGALTATNGTSDSDMFQIFINDPANFAASNTSFYPGANNFDSQIFLFNSAGLGVVGNDDAASGGSQSAIPAGSISNLPTGVYYLLISASGRYATSDAGLIFPNYTDGTTDPSSTVGPTGPGGALPISGYTGNSNDAGNYRVTLAGTQFVTAVPEPRTYAGILAAVAGFFGLGWFRRRAC